MSAARDAATGDCAALQARQADMEERLQSEAESSAARHSAEATVLRGERNAAKKEAAEDRKRVLSTNSEVHELRRRNPKPGISLS